MQPGYPAAALLAFYLIHDRIVGGKDAERIFFHLDTHKSYPGIRAEENCLLAFGAILSQSPSARATSSPSITALPLPEITPYISSLLLCEWTNGTPAPAIGLLVVYCFKDVASSGTYGIPEILSVLLIIVLHKWKKNTLLSIGGGTALYMLLVQTVFK